MEPLLTVDDVAVKLRKSPRWVRVLAKSNGIEASKVGGTWRFTQAAIDAYLSARDGFPKPKNRFQITQQSAKRQGIKQV